MAWYKNTSGTPALLAKGTRSPLSQYHQQSWFSSEQGHSDRQEGSLQIYLSSLNLLYLPKYPMKSKVTRIKKSAKQLIKRQQREEATTMNATKCVTETVAAVTTGVKDLSDWRFLF